MNGEIYSLQLALSEARSPRRWGVGDIPRELQLEFLLQYLRSRECQVTCRRINGYYMAQGFSHLRERLVADDPHLDPAQLRFFPGERMLRDGRTLFRFPRASEFTIYLTGNALPIDEADRVAAPLPYYRSATRVEDEVGDNGDPAADAPATVTPGLMSPDLDTPRS